MPHADPTTGIAIARDSPITQQPRVAHARSRSAGSTGKLDATMMRLTIDEDMWFTRLSETARRRDEAKQRAEMIAEQNRKRTIQQLRRNDHLSAQAKDQKESERREWLERQQDLSERRRRQVEATERARMRHLVTAERQLDERLTDASKRHAEFQSNRAESIADALSQRTQVAEQRKEHMRLQQEADRRRKLHMEASRAQTVQQEQHRFQADRARQQEEHFRRVHEALQRNEELEKMKQRRQLRLQEQQEQRRQMALQQHADELAARRARKDERMAQAQTSVAAAERMRRQRCEEYEAQFEEAMTIGAETRAHNQRCRPAASYIYSRSSSFLRNSQSNVSQ